MRCIKASSKKHPFHLLAVGEKKIRRISFGAEFRRKVSGGYLTRTAHTDVRYYERSRVFSSQISEDRNEVS